MRKTVILGLLMGVLGGLVVVPEAGAQDPELQKAMEFFSTAGIPGDQWIEGETFYPNVAPADHFNATLLYYPGTEELQRNEVRVTFMGSTYYPSQSQSGMSIFVELGNGDNFVFDLGIGSLRNYASFSIPFNKINHVFFSHLHMDHMSDLPYFMMFRPIQGGWTPLHIYGPSGSEPQYGIAYMIDRMMEMTAWHQDSFNGWPVGEGYDPVVHELEFMDEGGVAYEANGVRIIHWPTSHTKDGATSYRLDWNGRSLCYIDSIPAGSVSFVADGETFYYVDFNLYVEFEENGQTGYVNGEPEIGAQLDELPEGTTTIEEDERTFYQFDMVFFEEVEDEQGNPFYEVIESPDGSETVEL